MRWPSLSVVLSGLFIAYLSHTTWTMYQLFFPAACQQGGQARCVKPYLLRNPKLQLLVYVSTKVKVSSTKYLDLIWKHENFSVDQSAEYEVNITLPEATKKNGTLFVHVCVLPRTDQPFLSQRMVYQSGQLSTYMIPRAKAYNLMGEEGMITDSIRVPVSHLQSVLKLNVVSDIIAFSREAFPPELFRFARISPEGDYLPLLYIDDVSTRIRNLKEVNSSSKTMPLFISYSPISVGKLRLWSQLQESMRLMHVLGFSEKDTDEVKGLFADTGFYLLMMTFGVSALHLLFDFLAFKNDISFWKSRKSMEGLSTRTVVWRCISQTIVFMYLCDQDTSLLILIPAGIGSVIELWKVKKALKVTITISGFLPKLKLGSANDKEKLTEEFDSQAMRYLSYALYPLCAVGAIYSLLYTPHKSWYSWCVTSLVNGIYAFGFLFMLPQLFLNYKLKSVAHLPWRAFMYKAFNTFIDDVFAFIITMPTAHRLACFRDDIVFVVYLYQRWLYPVDKTRVNEFGRSYEHEVEKDEGKKKVE
ncbi:PREDICTED: cleft lip and palate transmembrane protein 1-like protein [Priapulus caudatus]|uniref:Lipid scramblase CLPTM1L n=1 Tax=Priapulus caudatus TaxID=37621 RepID=A0ABM1F9P2_PRICU|nr:PREDICTED: cleft lip and palate transmembrane protein 1-like protein [Priapulus caudatus]XP_014681164.1 PREDICTED: cleft lip and palate transmembrane protein 1-like protein [Priapulus caudatus]